MPLEKGSSEAAIGHNISELRATGHPEQQSVAIAEKEADKSRHDAASSPNCAGILFRAPGPQYLLVKRSDTGEWEQPGGHIEAGESPEEAAARECVEEIDGRPDGIRWIARTTVNPDGGDYTCFLQDVPEPFKPKLNDEHTEWQWASPSALPKPMHPEVAKTIELVSGNELDIAKRMVTRELPSPQRYENVWLFDLRITGTGLSYRTALKEYSWRTPDEFLTEEFRERCYGLPVIFEHPDTLLNSKEYRERNLGSIFLPYLTTDEVWGISKVFDDEGALLMQESYESTSPAVVFRDAGSAEFREIDGKTVLIEGKPSYLDHLAICKEGVWDKGGEPSGVNNGETQMDAMEEQVPAWADALGKRFDEVCSRLDAIENKGGDQMPTEELKADESEGFDKLEHKVEDEGYSKEAADKIAGKIGEEKYGKEGMEHRAEEGRKDSEHEHRKDAEHERHDSAEKDGEKEMKDERAADKELKAAEKEGEKEHKAEERADAVRNDAQARENADLKAQLKAMNARITSLATPLSVSDRDALSAAQARWDSVAQMLGDSVAAPLHGESPIAYRKRLAAKFQKHSDRLKGIRLDSLDDVSFSVIEDQIRADAQAYARSPAVSPAGRLIPIVRRDSAGRQITEYSGDMDTWLGHFKHHGIVAKILRQPNGVR